MTGCCAFFIATGAKAQATEYRSACSSGTCKIGKHHLRVAWTHAGIAYVDGASAAAQNEMRLRMRMELNAKPVPKLIRDALTAALGGGGIIDVPIDLTWARDFERDVLLAAREIPAGQTRPYRWLARQARRPLAIRAAASIIARNPLWLLVPAHRVVYANGKLGPYGHSGVAQKRALLKREGVEL